ncbi:MAG: adenylate/guanylate cyclase domain-containing protein [Luteibaculaceae bacterium]
MRFLKNILLVFLLIAFSVELANAQRIKGSFRQNIIQANQATSLDSASFYAERAYTIGKNNGVVEQQIEALTLLGALQNKNKNTVEALKNYLKALYVAQNNGLKDKTVQIAYQIGLIYQHENLFDKSNDYFLQAKRDLGNVNRMLQFNILIAVAENYVSLGEPTTAVNYLGEALRLGQSLSSIPLQIQVKQKKASIFELQENYTELLRVNEEIFQLLKVANANREELIAAYNNIGYSLKYLARYTEAKEYFTNALNLAQATPKNNNASIPILINLAVVSQNQGNINESIDFLLRANKLKNRQTQKSFVASIYSMLFVQYFAKNDLFNAENYNTLLEELALETDDNSILLKALFNSSLILEQQERYEDAFGAFKRYLALKDSITLEERLKQQLLIDEQSKLERIEKEIQLILAEEAIKDLEISSLRLRQQRQEQELSLLRQEKLLQEEKLKNELLSAEETRKTLLLAEEQLRAEQQEQEIRILFQERNISALKLREIELQDEERKARIELLTKENQLRNIEVEQAQSTRKTLIIILGIILAVLFLIYRSFVFAQKTNVELQNSNKLIQLRNTEIEIANKQILQEQDKANTLLLNILPENTAKQLKDFGSATPQFHSNVAIMFADFQSFSEKAQRLNPVELIAELNLFFESFDDIVEFYGIEKIKTIGDAYMCACGVPESVSNSSEKMILAALAFQEKVEEINKLTTENWFCRIGIHTGDVISGVVGKKKFAYDIWGDAVNIASVLERHALAEQVLVSEPTYQQTKNLFKFEKLPPIESKVHEPIQSYRVMPGSYKPSF